MSEKTEAPTGRKLGEARAEGQVARSVELNAAVALLVSAWMLRGTGSKLVVELQNLIVYSISILPRLNSRHMVAKDGLHQCHTITAQPWPLCHRIDGHRCCCYRNTNRVFVGAQAVGTSQPEKLKPHVGP